MTLLKLESLETRRLLTVTLVEDINLTSDGIDTLFFERATIQGVTYFDLVTSEHGAELWKTDGTNHGTQLVKDIIPGNFGSAPREVTAAGEQVFFVATTSGMFGPDGLWATDGSSEGTRQLADEDDLANSSIASIRPFGEGIVFVAETDDLAGQFDQLWRSDGTPEGTKPISGTVLDTVQEDSVLVTGNNVGITVLGDAIYVTRGLELWKSDGTAGIELVRDFQEDLDVKLNQKLNSLVAHDRLWVNVPKSTGSQLWVTDGSADGLMLVADFDHRTFSLSNAQLFGDDLYFAANSSLGPGEIFKSDGTSEGTAALTTGSLSNPQLVGIVDQDLFFLVDGANGPELRKTNVILPGTQLVHELTDIDTGGFPPRPFRFVTIGNAAYFKDRNDDGSASLWRYDSINGVQLLRTFEGGIPRDLIVVSNRLLFAAGDEAFGIELWTSDGTTVGTQLLRDIDTGTLGSELRQKAFLDDGTLLFVTQDGDNRALWAKNGPATKRLHDLPSGYGADGISLGSSALYGIHYFPSPFEPPRYQIWSVDGSDSGTKVIFDKPSLRPLLTGALRLGSKVFFTYESEETGNELWVTDGSTEGTRQVKDIVPGELSSSPTELTALGNFVIFQAASELQRVDVLGEVVEQAVNQELWRSDGTEAGTVKVADLSPGLTSSKPYGITQVGFQAYFFADSRGETGLWRTDGTEEGTIRIADGPPQANIAFGTDDRLFFVSIDNVDNVLVYSLWTSDGTDQGTQEIHTFTSDARAAFSFTGMTQLNNDLLFLSSSASEGALWKSNGTAEGTVKIRNLGPDFAGKFVGAIGNLAYFTHVSKTQGNELWVTDGTAVGTSLYDIHPGPGSSNPSDFVTWQDELYFTADDGFNGAELWKADGALPLAGDFDGDGHVSFQDFVVLAGNFGRANVAPERGDINGDNRVSLADFLVFSANFGKRAQPSVIWHPLAAVAVDEVFTDVSGKVSREKAVLHQEPTS